MRVTSVNVGSAEVVHLGDRAVRTGIGKRPVDRAVVNSRGVVDDAVVDTRHHGGVDQAVYLYGTADYDWWGRQLGRDDLHPGLFGENLTVDLGGHGPLRVGDRLRVGSSVELEVTAPRIPCAVFANAVGEERWVARFNEARRHGAYCRVLSGGVVSVGDRIRLRSTDPSHPDVEDLADLLLDPRADAEQVRTALAAPVAERVRADLERRLAKVR